MKAIPSFVGRIKPALSFLISDRPDTFIYQRFSEYCRFAAWLTYPTDNYLIELSAVTAVADVLYAHLKELSDGRQKEELAAEVAHYHFPPMTVMGALLIRGDLPAWSDAAENGRIMAETASIMARFLIQLENEPDAAKGPPSINRAVRFAEAVREASHQTMKDDWRHFAKVSPFLLAEELMLQAEPEGSFVGPSFSEPDIGELSTDYRYLFGPERRFHRLVATAAFLQERLTTVLRPEVAKKLQFIGFPDEVRPVSVDLPKFTEQERKIAHSYSVTGL